jgi:hypothetical protein
VSASGASKSGARVVAATDATAQLFQSILHGVGATRPNDMFVSDAAAGRIDVYSNKKFSPIRTFDDGIDENVNDFVDTKGNVYVADYGNRDVTEYAPNTSSPAFTYTQGLVDPVGAYVDSKGDVYVSDFGNARSGLVDEFPQGSNAVKYWCPVPGGVGGPEGVAIDSHGNVFVSYNSSGTGPGQIAEYPKGFKAGCKPTILPVRFLYTGGIAIDKSDNIVVADQGSTTTHGRVDIIAPPYDSVTSTFGSGFEDPFALSLAKNNKELFVVDSETGIVWIRKYPSGAYVDQLGKANGIAGALGVADAPEATH